MFSKILAYFWMMNSRVSLFDMLDVLIFPIVFVSSDMNFFFAIGALFILNKFFHNKYQQ